MTGQDWKKVRVRDHNRRGKREPPGRLESSTDSRFNSGYLYICYNQNGNQDTRLVWWDSHDRRRG